MSEQRVVVRHVVWRDIFPWLLLFRAFRLSFQPAVLLAAFLGVVLTPIGWRVADAVFVWESGQDAALIARARRNDAWPGQGDRYQSTESSIPLDRFADVRIEIDRLSSIPGRLFNARSTLVEFAYSTFGLLWTLAIWAFLGGTITRMACVQLGREERIGLRDALQHAGRKFLAYFGAPLFPVAGIAFLTLPLAILGLIFRLHVPTGAVIGGLCWWLVLIDTCLMAVLVLGLLFGWPLMWGVISSEKDGDVFEAFSRSYSYTFQRPLHYFFYVCLSVLVGALAWVVVRYFGQNVIALGYWGISWGAGPEAITALQQAMRDNPGGALGAGASLIHFFVALAQCAMLGFGYAFFWCSASAIYLLLRRDLDQTEFDEVQVDEQEQPVHELPLISRDAQGAPRAAAGSSTAAVEEVQDAPDASPQSMETESLETESPQDSSSEPPGDGQTTPREGAEGAP